MPAVILCMVPATQALAQKGSRVEINSDRIVVIDGRKVFPIGVTMPPSPDGRTRDGADAWAELRTAGVTFMRSGPLGEEWNDEVITRQEQWLDAAARTGLYCWVNLADLSCVEAGEEEKQFELRRLIRRFRHHPGLGFWKNYDEAAWGNRSADAMARGYRIIREEDPYHPVVQTHAPRGTVESLRPYNACADILNLDNYPIGYPPGRHSLLPNKEISMVGDWTRFLHEVAGDDKAYWMTLQIAWSGVIKEGKTLRFPTFPEERFMVYQAIINGARGLNFFGGHISKAMNAQDARLGWNWTFWRKVLRPVLEEIGERGPLASALVAPDSPLPVSVRGADDVEFCVREAGDDLFILACKRERETVQVEFKGLPEWVSEGRVVFEEPRTVQAADGTFTDWFGPFEVHVYQFRRRPAE
jgi:hypothetical protein